MAGSQAVGVDEPLDTKRLLVWVEIDRCVSDAIQIVTGCRLGKRTLKYVDYGKTAATFLNLETRDAVRVAARDDARESAFKYAAPGGDKRSAQVQAYKEMPIEELLVMRPVRVEVAETDMPGPPIRRVPCGQCGESVSDGREVLKSGRLLCRSCAGPAYYSRALPSKGQVRTEASLNAMLT